MLLRNFGSMKQSRKSVRVRRLSMHQSSKFPDLVFEQLDAGTGMALIPSPFFYHSQKAKMTTSPKWIYILFISNYYSSST